jgi:hypothetical protein
VFDNLRFVVASAVEAELGAIFLNCQVEVMIFKTTLQITKANITPVDITPLTAVRMYYFHEKNPPLEIPRAIWPSTLKGCVGTLKDGYVRTIPLP